MAAQDAASAPFQGKVGVGDTTLHIWDSGGSGQAVIYLNGCYASQGTWRGVVANLPEGQLRHIRFDARGRGRSGTSTDYSFESCLSDITAVLDQRSIQHAILVGWSYGATLAVYWANQNPSRVAGVVAVDGALPFGLTGPKGQAEIRRLFRRMSWCFPIARIFGFAGKMSGQAHAEINIEANEKTAECGPILASIAAPVLYVLGSGGNLGASHEVMEAGRATLRRQDLNRVEGGRGASSCPKFQKIGPLPDAQDRTAQGRSTAPESIWFFGVNYEIAVRSCEASRLA